LAGSEFPPKDPLVLDEAQLRDLLASGCCQSALLEGDLRRCSHHIAALLRRLSGAAYGLVSLFDDSLFDAAESGLGVVQACCGPAEPPPGQEEELLRLSAQGILQRQPLLVADTLADPRWRHHPRVQHAPHVRFLLSTPLIASDGRVLGHLGCLDPEPRLLPDPRLPPVGVLAQLVVRLLERRRLQQLLAQAERTPGPPLLAAASQLLQREQITQMLDSGFRLGLQSGYAVLRCEVKDHDRLCATHGGPLGAEIHTHDHAIPVTIAIGIVMVQDHHSGAGSVLADAAIARRMASRSRLSEYCFLDAQSRRHVGDDYALEASFREAIRLRELVPFFQPILDLASGEPVGFEALARWPDQNGDTAQPGTFLPIAQRSGLTGEMDLQIIRKALDAMLPLGGAAQGRSLVMSLNLSAQLLSESLLRNRLLELLASRSHPAGWRLQVEIVEEGLQDISPDFDSFLSRLSSLGIGIAIDDFGTGYSSLSRLNALPIQMVKIDRCFVQQIGHAYTPSDQLLRILNTLAIDLGLGTTAEGVENEPQRQWLLAHGFLYAQGFHFAAPMPLGEAISWLRALTPTGAASEGRQGQAQRLAQGPRRIGRRLRGALGRLALGH
jgi:EAL domain-containing protein (putative c-di-GMP-specific phosphodiesterase class I)